MKKQNAGFTLIELIVVIVIIGILAAVAIPRLSSLESEARKASIHGLLGAVKSASILTHATWLAKGGSLTSVPVEGQTVALVNGYPKSSGDGIARAIDYDAIDYTFTAGTTSTFELTHYSNANCRVEYQAAKPDGTPPSIVAKLSDC